MHPLGDALYHLRLLGLMGKTTEADLVAAFEAGRISSEDWADMVNRCRACEGIETCERWLATHESAEEAPGCCKNAKVLLRLRAEKEKAEA